jgi:hypothetical protein
MSGAEFGEIRLLSPEERADAELDAFVMNEGLDDLANLFGVAELPHDRSERLTMLQGVAAANWDFRNGAERQTTEWGDDLLDDPQSEQWQTIFAAADKLGLIKDTEPTDKTPDMLVVLGGANKAPLDRLRYGLSVVDDFKYVTYLGSSRAVSDTERLKAAEYAPHASTEFELGCGAVETFLNARLLNEIKSERNGDIWLTRTYQFRKDNETKHAFVLGTPRTIGAQRATTYDNYRFFGMQADFERSPDVSVVAVTTGFYTQGQHLSAVQELTARYGVKVETVGHSAEYSGVERKPRQLLQETKAAIDAAVRLEQLLASQTS